MTDNVSVTINNTSYRMSRDGLEVQATNGKWYLADNQTDESRAALEALERLGIFKPEPKQQGDSSVDEIND